MNILVEKAYAQIKEVPATVTPFADLGDLIGSLVQVALIAAGLLVFIFLIIGGIQYINSGGDKALAEKARDRITYAFIGLVIVVAAYAIALIIQRVFGIQILGGITFPSAPNTVGGGA